MPNTGAISNQGNNVNLQQAAATSRTSQTNNSSRGIFTRVADWWSGDMRDHSKKPTDYSLLYGLAGGIFGACSGAVLTWFAWTGLQKTFADKGVGFDADVDGSGSGDIQGSGNVEGADFDATASVDDIYVDAGFLGTIEIDTGGSDTHGATIEGEANITDATIDGTASGDFDADIGGGAELDLPGVPAQVVVTAAAIFLAVVGAFAYLTGRVTHAKNMAAHQNHMREQQNNEILNQIKTIETTFPRAAA